MVPYARRPTTASERRSGSGHDPAAADRSAGVAYTEPVSDQPAEPAPRPALRRPLVTIAVLLLIAALLVTVWRLGGFEKKQRSYQVVSAGTLISPGPYELSFTKATAQHLLKNDYRKGSWEVKVIGTGRTTGNETIAPDILSIDSTMFLARNPQSAEVQGPSDATYGEGSRSGFTPGLPPVAVVLTFTFSDSFPSGQRLVFAVADQVYSNNALIQTDQNNEKTWHNADTGWRMELPLSQLPPEKD